MKTYNLEDSEQKSLSQEIGDAIAIYNSTDIETLTDNNGYSFIIEYLSLQAKKEELDTTSEITLRDNCINEMSYAYFFQCLMNEIDNGRKSSEIGLMEAFLWGVQSSVKFPKYPVLYYIICVYLLKTKCADIDVSILDEIYNLLVKENSGISFKIQDYNKDFNLVDAIKLIGGEQ